MWSRGLAGVHSIRGWLGYALVGVGRGVLGIRNELELGRMSGDIVKA